MHWGPGQVQGSFAVACAQENHQKMPGILAVGRFFRGAGTTAVCVVAGTVFVAENSTEGNIAATGIGVAAAAEAGAVAEVAVGVEVGAEKVAAVFVMEADRVQMPRRTTKGSWQQAEAWGTHCSVQFAGTRTGQMLSSGKQMEGRGVTIAGDPGIDRF